LLKVPLGGPLGALRLEQIADDRRRHELSFDLPIAHRGRAIQAHALAASFRIQPEHSFSESYADRVASLSIHSRGFLTGSIDLMFSDTNNPQTSRWWVADWKSNWLGERDGDGQVLACGPCHYQREALLEEMVKHHYPLQAHLYMVALHRFLEWRLPGYDPQRNLGGYVYVFLRGVPEPEQLSAPAAPEFTPGILVEPAPVERILHLNQQLEGVIP
ncbi:MAG: DNA helicase UvrD, partial [Synechococcaceae bacterium WB9_4xC_028]|nr:DNA helicase UvrD [Synechococcaceae bacterium WB9_4xC_028]